MAQTVTLVNNVNLQIGTTVFGVTAVPEGFSVVSVTMNRANLVNDPDVVMSWGLELSTDNQQTWLPWGAAGAVGGEVRDPETGVVITESSFKVDLPGLAPATGWFTRLTVTTNNRFRTTFKAVFNTIF